MHLWSFLSLISIVYNLPTNFSTTPDTTLNLGALDGDGMPADHGDMKAYFATLPYTTVIKPRVDGVMAHLRSLGVAKVALVSGACRHAVRQHTPSQHQLSMPTLNINIPPSYKHCNRNNTPFNNLRLVSPSLITDRLIIDTPSQLTF